MNGRRAAFVIALGCVLVASPVAAQGSRLVQVSLPAAVTFLVTDVSTTTTAASAPARISFLTSDVKSGDRVYISVQADTSTFAGPGTTQIPVSKVSWTATGVGGSSGFAGSLSSTAYSQVLRSSQNPKSGGADMTWQLAPVIASGLRAGTHTLTVRWRIEAF